MSPASASSQTFSLLQKLQKYSLAINFVLIINVLQFYSKQIIILILTVQKPLQPQIVVQKQIFKDLSKTSMQIIFYLKFCFAYNLNYWQQMLNIPSTVVDSNYRYRMPKMQLKIQSKGNGIKTNIVNLPDVAKHLRTDQIYILKFFGYEKASQTNEKASSNQSTKAGKTSTSYIIQGSFTDEELLKTLDKFIEKYILCPKCKLPELNMYIVNEKINGKCDSCPFNGQIDNKHKLTSHILKNPPSYKPQAIKATKLIEGKVEEKSLKTEQKQNGKPSEKVEQQVKSQQPANKLFSAENLEFGSPEMEKLVQYTRNFIEARKTKDFDIACAETVDNLKSLGLKKTLFAYIVFNALFTVNIAKQVAESGPMYLRLIKRLVGSNQQNNEVETLLNTQYLFLQANKQKDFSKYIPTIVFKMNENGLFTKQFLLKWAKCEIKDFQKFFLYNESRNEDFMRMCQAFISSLQQEDDQQDQC